MGCPCCRRAFPSGEKVTYTGAEVVCAGCVAPQRHTARTASPSGASRGPALPASRASPASPTPASPAPGSPALASPASLVNDDSSRDARPPDQNGECRAAAAARPLPDRT